MPKAGSGMCCGVFERTFSALQLVEVQRWCRFALFCDITHRMVHFERAHSSGRRRTATSGWSSPSWAGNASICTSRNGARWAVRLNTSWPIGRRVPVWARFIGVEGLSTSSAASSCTVHWATGPGHALVSFRRRGARQTLPIYN
jgi:hypothetical protein